MSPRITLPIIVVSIEEMAYDSEFVSSLTVKKCNATLYGAIRETLYPRYRASWCTLPSDFGTGVQHSLHEKSVLQSMVH